MLTVAVRIGGEPTPVGAERGIGSDVEVIPIQKINEAYERLARGCAVSVCD